MLNRRMRLIALVLVFVMLFSMVAFGATESFKVKLDIFERLVVLAFYQQVEANFTTLKIVRLLQMELAPSEEEYKLAGLKDVTNGGVEAEDWDAVPEKEITFGEKAKEIIVNALVKLDEAEKLRWEHYTAYEKFVLEEEEIKEGE